MQVETFPYRINERTKKFLFDLISILVENDVRLAATTSRTQILFLNKGGDSTTIDLPITFGNQGVTATIALNAVAKMDHDSGVWLRSFHQFTLKSKPDVVPVVERCHVTVEARFDGTLKYYLTYMVAHKDGSLAQDMPQGRLYATESLAASRLASRQQASEPAQDAGGPVAAWLGPSIID